jgi:ABC-type polysaccharide/polyol phosphate transport system ATPase subunit
MVDSGPFSQPVVEFTNVGKRFRLQEETTLTEFLPSLLRGKAWAKAFWALRDVTFSIEKGETLGIIGHNGSGKSTILKLIAGVMAPSEGSVRVFGSVSPLIELGAGFHPDLTGRENIYLNASILGLTNAQIRYRLNDIIEFSELREFIDTPIKRYSSGMYLRLALSVAVHSSPEVLLVDEALAVGDAAFREKCVARMAELKASGVTVVLVSHNLALIQDFCDRALLLQGGHIQMTGPPGEVIQEYTHSLRAASLTEAVTA